MLPYGKQTIEADDIQAVIDVLQSDWLTTGPMVGQFESAFAQSVGVTDAVAVCNGTAALTAAMFAADLGPGDEVIVPAITFVATANAALYQNAQPVFADVDPDTMLIDPVDVLRKITPRTRALVAMDYAGQPCDYHRLRAIADEFDLVLIADACHSLGGSFRRIPVGRLADLSCFSLHPVKPITCGEGGVVTTSRPAFAERMRVFRNHGIDTDHRQREQAAQHCYDMNLLGHNLRLTDLQCALALSQLQKLSAFTARRNQIADLYHELFQGSRILRPLHRCDDRGHAFHLYVVRWNEAETGIDRDAVFGQMRERGIGVNVHYRPVYQHSFYRSLLGGVDHHCPQADRAYSQLLTLPVFPGMSDGDVIRVTEELGNIAIAAGQRKSSAA